MFFIIYGFIILIVIILEFSEYRYILLKIDCDIFFFKIGFKVEGLKNFKDIIMIIVRFSIVMNVVICVNFVKGFIFFLSV